MSKRTSYIDDLNGCLIHKEDAHNTVALDLFAGCGGLALGFEAQGFTTIGYEMNADCCNTYNHNLSGHCNNQFLTEDTVFPSVKVIIGGPPCQPFSVGGKQHGLKDDRNGFPAFVSAIKRVQPDIFLFENVKGLLYRNKWYLDQVISELKMLGYIVEYSVLNAINYGVPQNRERIIVVGHKGKYSFPKQLKHKVAAGEALGDMALEVPNDARFLTPNMDAYIANYEKASKCINPRDLNLSKPARTLTCRNLAGATGDMHRIKLPDGRRRRLSTREAARLQSFPDWFSFKGNMDSIFNQIGNAVPPLFAFYLATSIKEYLDDDFRYTDAEIKEINSIDEQTTLFSEDKKMSFNEITYINKGKAFSNKTDDLKTLINQALNIINELGVPFSGLTNRKLERMAMAFLAVGDIKEQNEWNDIKDLKSGRSMKTRDIISYWNDNFQENISSGSYDDVRRKDLKLLVLAGIILNTLPNTATNNPSRGYAINPEYTEIISTYGTKDWGMLVSEFMRGRMTLGDKMKQKRDLQRIEVTIPNGRIIEFSNGEHNELQKAIIESFLPFYGHGAELLYVGDTAKKHIIYEKEKLEELGFFALEHEELPDVIAYSKTNNWLFVIEAVYSCNPVSIVRKLKIEELTKNCKADIVYVSAFLTKKAFIEFASEIAWETEAWIADNPEHMVHFNGDKFLGPYNQSK